MIGYDTLLTAPFLAKLKSCGGQDGASTTAKHGQGTAGSDQRCRMPQRRLGFGSGQTVELDDAPSLRYGWDDHGHRADR